MFSALLTWTLAAALGQTPAEAAWLKALPADAEVVMHVRSVAGVRDDAGAMLKAMSPMLAEQAEPALAMAVDHLKEQFGEPATQSEFLFTMRLPKADDLQGQPAFAIVIPAKNADAIVKSLGDAKPEKLDGGYESVTGKNGETIYFYKGDGFLAFGPGKDDMVKAIAAKPSESFAGKAAPDSQKLLFAGDVGLYINLAAVQTTYAEQIAQGEEQFMAMLDQAGAQMQGGQIEQAKALYSTLFQTIKVAESLTLSIDADKAAFDLSGLLTVKADSDSAKTLKSAKLGNAAELAKLPANEMAYMYINFDPNGMEGLMKLNMANIAGGQGDEAVMKKTMEALKAAGRQETIASMSLAKPVSVVSLTTAEHPEKALEAAKVSLANMKEASPFMKDVKVEENAFEYKGFKFAKATMAMDFEKMAGEQGAGNPEAVEMMKRILGDGVITTYYGNDGNRTASIVADSEADAKAKLDAALDGSNSIGATPAYKALRSKLPSEVGGLVMFNAQEMVTQIAGMIGRLTGGEFKMPSMPKETALLGMSFAATPAGYRFDVVVPSDAVPVFEQGFGGLIQAMQGQVQN